MNPNKKVWIAFTAFVLALVLIACSCNSIIPTAILPTATLPPPPTPVPFTPVPPTAMPSPTVAPLPMAGLAGSWLDPDTTGTVTTIIALDGGYAADTVTNPNRGGNELTETNWANGVLTWTYCVSGGACVTTQTVSISGDSLDTTWSNDQGLSGSTTLQRVTSTTGGQEPIPGLAGYWLDTDTQVVHTIEWQNGQYVVISAIDATEGSYPITDQSWSNNTLTWTYKRPSTGTSVTFVTVSVSGDILHTTWTNSLGDSGTWDLQRASSPTP